MMNWNTYLSWSRILSFLLCATALALCVRSTFEPDIWWQLRTGEYILETGSVPVHDVFSYTYPEVKWINVKWLTEVIMALVANLLGVESLFILQMIVLCLILFILQKQHTAWSSFNKNPSTSRPPAFYLGVFLFLVCFSFRINGRPEMVSHLFTAVSCFLFWNFRSTKNYKVLLFAIPIQVLWANMHEAYGIGPVFWLIILAGVIMENLLLPRLKRNWKSSSQIAVLAVLVFASTAVSPNGFAMWSQPFNIFEQLGKNQFTTELVPFTDRAYWNLFSFLNLFLFAVGLLPILRNAIGMEAVQKTKKKTNVRGKTVLRDLVYLLLYLAFFYLSLKSYRNIPFFLIVGFPAISSGLFVLSKKWLSDYNMISLKLLTVFTILFYVGLVSDTFYNKTNIRSTYGWKIDETRTPHGAAEFIKSNNISGKSYTDFMVSSYLLWYLQPDYKTFIDLRDLDIFPEQFFKNNILTYQKPDAKLQDGREIWNLLVDEDDYNYVVLINKPNIINLQRHLVHKDDRYDLVYADDVSSLYLKNTAINEKLLEKYGLRQGNDVYNSLSIIRPRLTARIISRLFNPFYGGVAKESESNQRSEYYKYIDFSFSDQGTNHLNPG